MMRRSLLYHAAGIGAVCLTVVLLLASYATPTQGLAFLLVVLAFAPGYSAARYLEAVRVDRALKERWLSWAFCMVLFGAAFVWLWGMWPK